MEYIALGNFDGMHIGHRALISKMVSLAKIDEAAASVCIFNPHPMKILKPDNPPKLLTSLSLKKEILKSLGIEKIHILDFDKKMMNMNGILFLDMLKNKYDIGMYAMGYNYNFGRHGRWDVEDIKKYCSRKNIKSLIFDRYRVDNIDVSSTNIRNYLNKGNLDIVKKLINRPHIIEGKVIKGINIGEKIGFPTANINYDNNFCYPPDGVYFTAVKVDTKWYYSITNIGMKPTVDSSIKNIETHVLNKNIQLYDKDIEIALLKYIRKQIKFKDINELKKQLIKDKKLAFGLSKNFPLEVIY